MKAADDIWKGDLLDRREEAEVLAAYIESASREALSSEDSKSFTIAVDAPYGVGKSYFLKRLKEHLSLNHPVAFVDAWSDDLADEPFTALAATLKEALDPLIEKSPALQAGWQDWLAKSSKVATVMGKGVAKRLLIAAITAGAVNQLSDVVLEKSGDAAESMNDELERVGETVVDSAQKAMSALSSGDLMKERIDEFEKSRAAVKQLKRGLSAIVERLGSLDYHPPVIIIVDELDRCRPTYAIKLLEEVKHLFDVPGVVFVFGLHGDQLANAMSGVYGPAFKGDEYLRRFITRTYALKIPPLGALLDPLLADAGVREEHFIFPEVKTGDGRTERLSLPELAARYMAGYEATARDAYRVVDGLRTCVSIASERPLIGPYILPLVIAKVLGQKVVAPLKIKNPRPWITYGWYPPGNNLQSSDSNQLAERVDETAKRSPHELRSRTGALDLATTLVIKAREGASGVTLADPSNYQKLVDAVGRLVIKKPVDS